MSKTIDITGKRFGRLTVISKSDKKTKNKNVHWNCLCDCGNLVVVNGYLLRSGHTQSCGCFQRDKTSEAKRKTNIYNLEGKYGIGYTTNTNKIFMFDKEDYPLIINYAWHENDKGYICTHKDNSVVRLHRLVLGLNSDDAIVDHINMDKADNRKINLRFANRQLNNINRGCNCTNKLGHKGISKLENGKYMARVMKNGKTYYLGSFNNIEDAINARYKADIKLFGEFAYKEG